MSKNKEIGLKGESAAVNYLKRCGYKILERNYRNKQLEIDIIAEKEGILVFAEVKTRSSMHFGEPAEAVNEKKINNILSCAAYYIEETDWQKEIRFDIISVYVNLGMQIRHMEDAFF